MPYLDIEVPVWNKDKPYAVVTDDGSWLNYPSYYWGKDAKVVYIEPFEARLKLEDFSRGRSAANFNLVNVGTGAKYTMFMKDFLEYIQQHGHVIDCELEGTWTVVKRGGNYGIKHV